MVVEELTSGSREILLQGHAGNTSIKIDPQKLVKYIEEYPDAYLSEIASIFSCSEEAVCKVLKRMGYKKKKRKLHIRNKTDKKSSNIWTR